MLRRRDAHPLPDDGQDGVEDAVPGAEVGRVQPPPLALHREQLAGARRVRLEQAVKVSLEGKGYLYRLSL